MSDAPDCLVISFNFENVEKSYAFSPLCHCTETVLRDPLLYATFSLRSLEGSHITVSTVVPSAGIQNRQTIKVVLLIFL